MRSAAYLLVGFLLVLVQGTAYRFLNGLMGLDVFGHRLETVLAGGTPNLVLPFIVYLGIHEHSTARGVLLSFGLGWCVDILGGGPAFLFRFTMVAIWALSRVASSRVSAQSAVSRIPLAFVASLLESATVLTLLAIFGVDYQRPIELTSVVLPRAVTTALFAPVLFELAHRLNVEAWGSSSSSSSAQSVP